MARPTSSLQSPVSGLYSSGALHELPVQMVRGEGVAQGRVAQLRRRGDAEEAEEGAAAEAEIRRQATAVPQHRGGRVRVDAAVVEARLQLAPLGFQEGAQEALVEGDVVAHERDGGTAEVLGAELVEDP